jgi:hypothetical protein
VGIASQRGRKSKNRHVVEKVIQTREGMDYNEQEEFQDDDEKLHSGNDDQASVMCGIKCKDKEEIRAKDLTTSGKAISTLMTKQKSVTKVEIDDELSLGMSDSEESEEVTSL